MHWLLPCLPLRSCSKATLPASNYVISTSDEPEAVWVSEVWTEADAHDASLSRPEIRGLIERVRPLVAGMSDQTQLHVHGGKGVEKITK
jgi:quinol monooxygenase YgiN